MNEYLLNHTMNSSSTRVGNCMATVIASTNNPNNNITVTTFELIYPRFIHSEFMTHRMFSRNASSSRAIPIKRLIEEATVMPTHWMQNSKGMVNNTEITDRTKIGQYVNAWKLARKEAIRNAERLESLGLHKQIVNRLLEPFSFIKVVVTATEWDNFFKLRLADDAEPHMRDLATAMKKAMSKVYPVMGFVHAPYCEEWEKIIHLSAARCARVSYNKHDGTPPSTDDDFKLAESLIKGGHMTPFEHFCYASPSKKFYANLKGWYSARYKFEHGVKNGSRSLHLFDETP